ncbi:hypothetical protein EG68_03595 [Paragonimus skrjabini miyazakii]|uniref:Tektin n=1 Tax=Paragonimus skrjabini miyazakii TaxID=59628 RepID=A0A8S9YWW2_9TREM|nr:hypothetical protein EG68_03595 [Paragonimus skrjabini miyazakii]
MNSAAQNDMQKDACDKNHAYAVDHDVHNMCNTSSGIGLYRGVELEDNSQSIPISWMKFTQENLSRSQKQRACSEQLRGKIKTVLRNVKNAIYGQFNVVNNALQTRIMQTMNARDQLRTAIKKIVQEIYETEKLVQLLTQSIEDKLKPLKVAETRLKERTKRHSMELCQDDPMKTLQCETIELRTIIRALKDKLHQACLSQTRLQRNQEALQADIAIKENSLEIDQRCLNIRKTFPINDKRGTLLSVPVSY